MHQCKKMWKDGFGCARKQRQECESRSPLFGNPLIAELAVSKSCTLAVSRVAWSGTIDAIDACHHISTTFPLPHCANIIAIFATLWETLQNDKGIWVLKGKVVHGFLVWVCRGILQCESVMDMQRSRLIDEEAETIGQIYINAKSCLSIGLHRQVAEQILSGRRSMSCLWSTHSFLKPILQHPVRRMLSPMLRPLSPWSGIPCAPFGQSRQSKSNRCRWKVNGKEWKHYGIQGLLVSLLALLAFDARVTMRFLTVLQFVTFGSITFILALCTLEHNIECQ